MHNSNAAGGVSSTPPRVSFPLRPTSERGAAALKYAAMGWHVIPCWPAVGEGCGCPDPECRVGVKGKSPGKHPIADFVPRGQHNATTDADVIANWWSIRPEANVAIYLAPSGLCAVDIDPRNGGDDTIEALEGVHGKIESDVLALTGGGGEHRIFQAPADGAKLPGKLGAGVDMKSDGYILVEPSNHTSGGTYQWEGSSDPTEGCLPSPLPSFISDQSEAIVVAPATSGGMMRRELSGEEVVDWRNKLSYLDADDYHVWITVGMAFKRDVIAKQARELWDEWSATSKKFNREVQNKKAYSFGRSGLDDSVGLGTVSDMVKEVRHAKEASAKLDAVARGQSTPPVEPTVTKSEVTPSPGKYPIEALPPLMLNAVSEVCGAVQAPFAMVAASAVSALSAAAQGFADVERSAGLSGPVSLYSLVLAESGERKTSVDNKFTAVFREFEREQEVALKSAIRAASAKYAAWVAKTQGLEAAIKSAVRGGKPTDSYESALVELKDEEPERVIVPRTLIGDATVEALQHRLYAEHPSAAIIASEGGIVFGGFSMGQERIMGGLAAFNQFWDGAEISVDRRTSDSYVLRDARVTVNIQVQPQVIEDWTAKSRGLARGSGFFARFLFANPVSTQGTRYFKEMPLDRPKGRLFDDRIKQLLARGVPRDSDGRRMPTVLKFRMPAAAKWREFHDEIEDQLGAGGELSDVRDIASKAADNVARMAALFHILESDSPTIGVESVVAAATVVRWHLTEARRILGEVLASPEEIAAAKLLNWLIDQKQKGCNTHSRRDMLRLSPVRNGKVLSDALVLLSEEDDVKETKQGRTVLWELSR